MGSSVQPGSSRHRQTTSDAASLIKTSYEMLAEGGGCASGATCDGPGRSGSAEAAERRGCGCCDTGVASAVPPTATSAVLATAAPSAAAASPAASPPSAGIGARGPSTATPAAASCIRSRAFAACATRTSALA